MRGLDAYYGGDDDAFPDAEELAERVEQLEAENAALRERITRGIAACDMAERTGIREMEDQRSVSDFQMLAAARGVAIARSLRHTLGGR